MSEQLDTVRRGLERSLAAAQARKDSTSIDGFQHALDDLDRVNDALDTLRLNWLTRMDVEVRQPLVHGSRQLFLATPTEVEGGDDEPSNLRAQIDYQMHGGKKP